MNPSASALYRAMLCPASACLPRVETSSEAAERGTIGHKFLERVASGGNRDEALAAAPFEHREWLSRIDPTEALAGLREIRCELPIAIAPGVEAARLLPKGEHRDYSAAEAGEFCGTGDLFATREDGAPVYLDWKCSNYFDMQPYIRQVQFFGLALHLMTGAPAIEWRACFVGDDGRIEVKRGELTAFDFDDMLLALRILERDITRVRLEIREGRVPTVNMGDHCKYCSAMSACPGYTALARQLDPELTAIDGAIASLTPVLAGKAWLRYKQAEQLLERIGKGLKAYAQETPIELPNGKRVRAIQQTRNSINGEAALRLAQQYGASQEELAACTRANTFTAIRETT